MKRTCVAAVAAIMVLAGAARADYTPWVKDEKAKTYTCEYTYTGKDTKPAKQTVVIYYEDPDRKNWAYYYNAKKAPWARCAVPGNPKYNAKVMYWQQLDPIGKDKYKNYDTAGYCPTPGDGTKPIPDLPLPPK